uniref:tRNA-uridine aminocarboxypropyltransferase n=1 Tax=Alexandrium andersonii TaxID=327968 RepID=A0A7S2G8C1_9DINO
MAKQMVFRTPWLQTLPRVCLEPEEESHYTFRRQPHRDCVSTLEAVAECLLALESDVAKAEEVHASLNSLFGAMVAHQVSFIPRLSVAGSQDVAAQAGGADAGSMAATTPKKAAAPRHTTTSYCLARYERGVGGVVRRAVVEETLRHTKCEDAVARAKELSASRSKDDRLHVVPLEKVRRMKGVGDLVFEME